MNPVFFQSFKHHAIQMAENILQWSQMGEEGLSVLLKNLLTFGEQGTSDVYFGDLKVETICQEVEVFLQNKGILDLPSYEKYLENEGDFKRQGHYMVCPLSDGAQFVLRNSEDPEQYAHIHPGRYSPNTVRVRINTLKSALVAHFLALQKKSSVDFDILQEARKITKLSPVPEIPSALQEILDLLGRALKKVLP